MGSMIQVRPEVPGLVVLLLADDGVVGEEGGQLLAQQRFGVAVGHGDRRVVVLVLHLELDRAEVRQGRLARHAGQGHRLVDERGVAGGRVGHVGERTAYRLGVTDVAPAFFNPLDPDYIADPYPFLAKLRETEPVHQSPLGLWMLFEYQDVFELLRNPNTSVSDANVEGGLNELREQMFADLLEEYGGEERTRGDRAILSLDPPDHTRIRKLVSKAFTVRRIEALRPRIQELVDEVLDRVAGTGTWDVVDELAFPLPFQVISELLGMPEGDRAAIREWSHALTKTLDPIVSEEDMRAAFEASDGMRAYLEDAIAWKRANPADDVLTGLVQAEEDGDTLSADELQDQIVLLFIAGHETTVNLIGNGLKALLANPDQMAALAGGPVAGRHRGRRVPPLRRPGADVPSHRHGRPAAARPERFPRGRWS